MHIAVFLAGWTLYVDAVEEHQTNSVHDVCDLLTSLSAEGQMLTRFNGVIFNDFKTGKNGISEGPLAIGGSFRGDNAMINQRNELSCGAETESSLFGHHGLILKGTTESAVKVNGFAHIQDVENSLVTTPLNECSVKTAATNFDFEIARTQALTMSREFAGMLPNWSIDKMGAIVNIVSEGISVKQPYNLFSMPVYCPAGPSHAKNYFACKVDHDCEIPAQHLSDVHAMFLGKTSNWTGPVVQDYPQDKLMVINIPVTDGQTFDIQTKNPSIKINACNTIYNFYAVDKQGRYEPEGNFTLKRSTEKPLSGMILAPQAHVIDSSTGSFAGQIIADSYESNADDIRIQDYQSASTGKCQAFAGCV
ncbi:hypothetical protein INT47_011421 [Mucor saturninus]|uniref:Choice-of-anchor A domain-containing protein n=1 Tax=Mucor saturninus TaxID=64648 RepID=A0A8H7QXC3_9FUNG|nr:hypothetical protein INT47_011421 [Mucor saturninus]